MSRQEHLAWCKARAREYLEAGDYNNAIASMCSDLGKHDQLRDHPGQMLGIALKAAGALASYEQVRAWIEGFN